MKSLLKALIVVTTLMATFAMAGSQQEIDHLLNYVESTPCQYERNGTLHNGRMARGHIEMKYNHYRKKVRTAEDFIKYSATRSSISGSQYQIICPNAEAVNASDWLQVELNQYRSVGE